MESGDHGTNGADTLHEDNPVRVMPEAVGPAPPVLDAMRAKVLEALFPKMAAPERFGRYVVLDLLGEGGMGTVLRAFDLDRPVAIKVLHEHLGDKHTARLKREAQAMAKLSHPKKSIELAFISGMAHRDSPIARDVGRALWLALASEDQEHGDLIWDMYISSVGTDTRRALEMELGDWLPQGDWGHRIYEHGQQAGEAKGKAEGEARALLTILRTRGIRLASTQLGRVRSCRSIRRLDTWLRRAATATTAAEVFDEP